MIAWTARQSFIDKHRAAMVDFMEDMLRITRWYQDPKNHDEVAQIASQITKVPPERFGWLFTKQDTFRDPNMVPNSRLYSATSTSCASSASSRSRST